MAGDHGIITQEKLMELTGIRQKAALRRHLKRSHVAFHEINGRILTTEEAFNAPLVGRAKKTRAPNLDALTAESKG